MTNARSQIMGSDPGKTRVGLGGRTSDLFL